MYLSEWTLLFIAQLVLALLCLLLFGFFYVRHLRTRVADLKTRLDETARAPALPEEEPDDSEETEETGEIKLDAIDDLMASMEEEDEEPTDEEAGSEDGTADEISALKERIENLEVFKKLFFELQEKFEQAKTLEATLHDEIEMLVAQMESAGDLPERLATFHNLFGEFGETLASPPASTTIEVIEVGAPRKNYDLYSEEVSQLKSVNTEQSKLIRKLKQDLQNADQDQAHALLEEHANRLERLMKESETCIIQLESELQEASQRIKELEAELTEAPDKNTPSGQNEETGEVSRDLQQALNEKIAELTELQNEYNDLEQRYLDLYQKTKS